MSVRLEIECDYECSQADCERAQEYMNELTRKGGATMTQVVERAWMQVAQDALGFAGVVVVSVEVVDDV
jgi:hypothetical protein